MTPGDDGGFKPHPGDPWHPGWDSDEAAADAAESDATGKKEKRRRSKGPKKSRRRAKKDAVPAEPDAFDPKSTAFDVADAVPEGPDGSSDDDPFGAVLQSERSGRRRRADDAGPPPAWTVDEEPADEPAMPVEQPSWAGQSTEPAVAVESLGFDAPEIDDGDSGEPLDAIGADGDPGDTGPQEVGESLPHESSVADLDVGGVEPEVGGLEPEIAGQYGVAGPEAYDVLDTADTPTGELDDWSAFMDAEETGAVPGVATPGEVGEESDLAPVDEDEWFDETRAQPKKGRFRRKRSEESVIDDGFVGSATERPRPDPDSEAAAVAEALFGAPTEALAGGEAFDEWVDSQPTKKRRGLFGRRKGRDRQAGESGELDPLAAYADDGAFGLQPDPGSDPEMAADAAPYEAPIVESDVDETPEMPADAPPLSLDVPVEDLGLPLSSDALSAEADHPSEEVHEVEEPDLESALIEALDALGQSPAPEVPQEVMEPVVDLPDGATDPETPIDQPAPPTPATPGEVAVGRPRLTSEEPEPVEEGSDVDELAARQTIDPEAAEALDWEGDPSGIPAGWFAEIDEDEVVPPSVADTPETEWPVADTESDIPVADTESDMDASAPEVVGAAPEGPSVGQVESGGLDPAGVDAEAVLVSGEMLDAPTPEEIPLVEQAVTPEQPAATSEPLDPVDTDLFDLEAPEPTPESAVMQPPSIPVLPEGYEPWDDAVEEALESAGEGGPRDDGTYEYEPLVTEQQQADVVPAGFERFPGGMEQFEIRQDELDAEMGVGGGDRGWVTSDVDPGGMVDPEFDESIYAGPGTIEHRDLAALIAQAGDEDTQWQAISAAMPGLETGVLGFEDVADLGQDDDYVAPVRSNLSTRVATGLLLLILLFGSLFVADIAFVVFISVMLLLGLVEFYAALRRSGYLPLTLFGVIGGGATLVATWFHGPLALPAGVLLTSMATYFFYAFSPTRRDALANGGLTVLGIGWVVGTIGFVIPIARAEDHIPLVLAVVLTTAAMDIGAFSFGRTWGKRALSPNLSPNKTTEGLAGGVLAALAVAAVFGFLEIGPFDLTSALVLGGIVAFAAPFGDLAESMVKRSLGIKDMGATLPGHGGVMDRIDAFLFVVPAAWALFEILGFLG